MTPAARAVFLRVLDYSNDHGKDVVPTIATIGEAEQRAERTAAGHLAQLERDGWIAKHNRAAQDEKGHWFGRSNITRPTLPPEAAAWLRETGHVGGKGRPTPNASQSRPRTVGLPAPTSPGDPVGAGFVPMPESLSALARDLPRPRKRGHGRGPPALPA
jgi:hypothetical protein